jgi:hypothetical protein
MLAGPLLYFRRIAIRVSLKRARAHKRDRRRRYLALLAGQPTNEAAARIDALVRLEWAALKCEAEGTLLADREARASFSSRAPMPV